MMPFDDFQLRRQGWAYKGCFTIDPTKGAKAWEKLNRNQFGLEIGMLPKILHEALLETLKERQTLQKAVGKKVE